MIERLEKSGGKIIGFRLKNKLHEEDYSQFVPAVEEVISEYGKVRLLALFEDFRGWDLKALWDDIKLSAQHYHDVEKIAIVGSRKWEEWMAKVCRPFTSAQVRHFNKANLDAAWKWLEEDE